MSTIWEQFNSGFWLSMTGLIIGSVATCFAYMYKSKCTSIKICGLIDIVRDVEAEIEDQANQPQVIEPIVPQEIKEIKERRKSYIAPERRKSLQSSTPNQTIDFNASMNNKPITNEILYEALKKIQSSNSLKDLK
jgi:hypothetical protein